MNEPSILDPSVEGALQRNDALRVLHLAVASTLGVDAPLAIIGSLLRDIEKGGYTLRLTTDDERRRRNAETGPSR